MREIKFRAIPKLKIGGNKTFEFTLDEIMRAQVIISSPEHWHFLQFTGLKDKNGKEIFEGDIVKNQYYEHYGIIEYRPGSFIVNYIKGIGTLLNNSASNLSKRDELEVIGNIFENPELLKHKGEE